MERSAVVYLSLSFPLPFLCYLLRTNKIIPHESAERGDGDVSYIKSYTQYAIIVC